MGTYITLAIIYTIALLIWTKVNAACTKENNSRSRHLNDEIREIRETNREVEGIEVTFHHTPPILFNEAKTYEEYRDRIEILDADRAVLAHLERNRVEGVFVKRKGETHGV